MNIITGKKSEDKFAKFCKDNSIFCISTKDAIKWSPELDSIYGDYIINYNDQWISIDVKGGFISKLSIYNFRGDYYVVYEGSDTDDTEAYVFPASIIKKLIKGKPDSWFSHGSKSGDPGIHFKELSKIIDKSILLKDKFKSGIADLNGLIDSLGEL